MKTSVKEIKKRAFLLALFICLFAVALSTALVVTNKGETSSITAGDFTPEPDVKEEPTPTVVEDPEPDVPVTKTVIFEMPVDGSVLQSFSTTPVYDKTLNRYASHTAIDFSAEEGSPVFAVYDGVVKDVTNSITKGVTVTVDHGDGLITVYNSLESVYDVEIGQSVKKGDIIGHVSTSNRTESADGAHLHFETIENGEYIDPEKYLLLSEK